MPPPRGDDLMAAVLGLRRVVRRRLRDAMPDPVPLRGAQIELLQLVEREPGIGVAAAARGLHLAANTVSTLVNQLVGADLLRRTTDPADRRAVCLEPTGTAHERLSRWRAARTELVTAGLHALTDAERAALGAALPVLDRLTVVLGEPPHVPITHAAPTARASEEAR